MNKHLEASPESARKFYERFQDKGKVVMLNLLKFRAKADYSNLEQLKPKEEISGEKAYQLYMESILPELKKVKSRVLFYGKTGQFLIGPDTENWDAVLMVEHQSASKFMEFAQSKDYLKNAGHRTAALEDSRLLHSIEMNSDI